MFRTHARPYRLAMLIGFSAVLLGWTTEASAFHLSKVDRRPKVIVVERSPGYYPGHYYRRYERVPPRHPYWHRYDKKTWKKHWKHDDRWPPRWGHRR